MTKLTFGEAAFDSHGSLGPWSDSMTGASMARLEHHYLGLTVHSCPGLIICFVWKHVLYIGVNVYRFAVETIHLKI